MLTIEKLKEVASTCPYGGWLAVTEGTGELIWGWFKKKPYFNGDAWVSDEEEDSLSGEVFGWFAEQGVEWDDLNNLDLFDLIETEHDSACIKCGTTKKQKTFTPIIEVLKSGTKGFLCDDGKNIYWSQCNFGFDIAEQKVVFAEDAYVFKLVKKPKGTKHCHTKEKTVMLCPLGDCNVYLFSTFKMFETNLCKQMVYFEDLNKEFANLKKGTVTFAKVYRDYGKWGEPKLVECNKEDYIHIIQDFDNYSQTWKAEYDSKQKQLKLTHL